MAGQHHLIEEPADPFPKALHALAHAKRHFDDVHAGGADWVTFSGCSSGF
jgi:hypothetical protein